MTIPTETSRMDYVGNGVTTIYPYTFKIDDETELVVVKADTNGAETDLVLNTDYTVSGVGSQGGGNVILTTALASGYALTIQVTTSFTQETDIKNQGAFAPQVIEDALDHGIRAVQTLKNSVGRSIQLPVTSTGINTTLANLAPGQFVRLSDDGYQLEGAQAFATLTDATQDGKTYGRNNGAWVEALPNGSVTEAKLGLVGSLGWRNKIINGAMNIDQRNGGVAQTITAAAAKAYTVDQWYAYCTGANVTGQQVAGTSPNKYNYRFTGAASVSEIRFGQRMEAVNSQDMAGKATVLSVDLANSLLTTVTWTAYYANTEDTFGSLGSPTRTQIATGTFTVTSTLTRYTASISVPAAATTGVEIVFSVGAQTSGTWTIGRVQWEVGSTPTVFEYRNVEDERNECYRYYERFITGVIFTAAGASHYGSAPLPFKAAKRALPSVSTVLAIASINIASASYDLIDTIGGRYVIQATAAGACSAWVYAEAVAVL